MIVTQYMINNKYYINYNITINVIILLLVIMLRHNYVNTYFDRRFLVLSSDQMIIVHSSVYLGFIIAIHWVRKIFFAIFRVPYRKLKSKFLTIIPLQVVHHLELRNDFLYRE